MKTKSLFFYLILIFFASLMFFRKNIALFKLFNIYYIELFHILLTSLFFVEFRKKVIIFPKNFLIILIITIFFIILAIIRSFSGVYTFQSFIPVLYIFYIPYYFLIFFNLNTISLIDLHKNYFNLFYIFAILFFLFQIIGKLLNLEIIGAGNTLINPVVLFSVLIFNNKKIIHFIVLFLYLVTFLFTLERSLVTNLIIPPIFLFFFHMKKVKFMHIINFSKYIFYFSIITCLFTFLFLPFLNNNLDLRFELNISNIFSFIETIWNSNSEFELGGANGSRNHRLSMWLEVINDLSNSPYRLIFGDGFNSPIVDNEFSGIPHNGFISIMKRIGLFGLCLYLILISLLLYYSINNRFVTIKFKIFISSIYIALFFEIMTQTILDSPFTIILVYQIFTFSYAYSANLKTITY